MVNSKAIRRRLKELNLKQKDAADCIGCKPSTASLKINNRRPMYLDEAWKLAVLLGVESEFQAYFFAPDVA